MASIFVRMPTAAIKMDVLQSSVGFDQKSSTMRALETQPDVIILDVDEDERRRILSAGGIVYEDVQFETCSDDMLDESDNTGIGSTVVSSLSLRDVVEQINAPSAWQRTRGNGVTIVIIDTGVSSTLREVPAPRRSKLDLSTRYNGQHWQDPTGHGSMCAAIAAGSMVGGGKYDGVAPEADVLSARSDLTSRDLTLIYDELIRAKANGKLTGPIVVSNSYGMRACRPPGILPADHPFLTGIMTAIASGIFVCFAAGNNHHDILCNYDPRACEPNTIWGANSHDEIVSVGTVNRDLTNRDPRTPHVNSSRGPGEWASTTTKPDCVAPTYGEVPWGSSYKTMPWWGTSGACPQVAGAAALILSVAPHLDARAISHIIRSTCRPLGGDVTCVGRGLLDCGRAVAAAVGA